MVGVLPCFWGPERHWAPVLFKEPLIFVTWHEVFLGS
jgi:hypothetical protein